MTEDEVQAARHLLGFHHHPAGELPGGFTTKLIETLEVADHQNRAKLLSVFPAFRHPIAISLTEGLPALAAKIRREVRSGWD